MNTIVISLKADKKPVDLVDIGLVKELFMPTNDQMKRLHKLGFSLQFDF